MLPKITQPGRCYFPSSTPSNIKTRNDLNRFYTPNQSINRTPPQSTRRVRNGACTKRVGTGLSCEFFFGSSPCQNKVLDFPLQEKRLSGGKGPCVMGRRRARATSGSIEGLHASMFLNLVGRYYNIVIHSYVLVVDITFSHTACCLTKCRCTVCSWFKKLI